MTRQIHIARPVLGAEEALAVREALESGWITQGPKVAAFEQAFAKRHDVAHALAVTNCTTAMHLVLAALGIGPGDEVIVPAFTWVATANVVLYTGATPIFVDVDPKTFNLDPAQLAEKITPKTKAVIPVHLFGLCADMDAIREVADELFLIEDAACAAGAHYKGRSAGALGLAGCFSFHPRKSITTGEGGMVTTNDDALAERMTMMRNHGASISEEQRHHGPKPYLLPEFNLLGFNYRMTDLQGAVGLVQMGKLDRFQTERNRWAGFYEEALAELDWLHTPSVPQGSAHGWQAYVCYVDEGRAPMSRNALMEKLQEQGISTRPGTHAVHQLGLYRDRFGIQPDDFPGARDCDRFSLAIPLHNHMAEEDYVYVVNQLRAL